MSTTDPITPPPELVAQWSSESLATQHLCTQAARWGSDQELEACVKLWSTHSINWTSSQFRAARRPKPPSLKEQAFDALHCIHDQGPTPEQVAIICRALEALPYD